IYARNFSGSQYRQGAPGRTASQRSDGAAPLTKRRRADIPLPGFTGKMQQAVNIPLAKDKTLFTPGPLTTSLSVKQAMLRDMGSWHWDFNELVRSIRERLLDLAGVSCARGFEAIL